MSSSSMRTCGSNSSAVATASSAFALATSWRTIRSLAGWPASPSPGWELDDLRGPEHIGAGKIAPVDEIRRDRLPTIDIFANNELVEIGQRRRRGQQIRRRAARRGDVDHLGATRISGHDVAEAGHRRSRLELLAKGFEKIGRVDLQEVDELLGHESLFRPLGEMPRKPERAERCHFHDAHSPLWQDCRMR